MDKLSELENAVVGIEILEAKEKELPKTESGIIMARESDTKSHRIAKILSVSDDFPEDFIKRAKVGRTIAIPLQGRERGAYKVEIKGEEKEFYTIPKSDILFYLD